MFDWSNSLLESNKFSESYVSASTKQGCSIRYAKAHNKDYVFIISFDEVGKADILKELVAYLAEDVLLEHSCCEIITVHFNRSGKQQYRRFSLQWSENGAQLMRPKERNGAYKAEFLDFLFFSSVSVEDFEDDE